MKQVDDFFSEAADRTLYHYTGIGAVLGIVTTRTLWASHAYYLNDSREILHARDVLRSVLKKRAEQDAGDVREFLMQFIAWLKSFSTTPYHIFLFSLSEERSLLSQWRSYTPHGKGVSLGFSAARLNDVLSRSGFRIARCLYNKEEQFELMSGLLEKMLVTFNQRRPHMDLTKHHPDQKYHSFLEEFRGDLLRVFTIVKHSAFREENEWRIVSDYFPRYAVPEIKFREGASMLVPYIELALSDAGDSQALFEEVILGPSQHADLSMNALSNFLRNTGACSVTANCSIPYRKWPE